MLELLGEDNQQAPTEAQVVAAQRAGHTEYAHQMATELARRNASVGVHTKPSALISIPFEAVRSIWKASAGWHVAIRGFVFRGVFSLAGGRLDFSRVADASPSFRLLTKTSAWCLVVDREGLSKSDSPRRKKLPLPRHGNARRETAIERHDPSPKHLSQVLWERHRGRAVRGRRDQAGRTGSGS